MIEIMCCDVVRIVMLFYQLLLDPVDRCVCNVCHSIREALSNQTGVTATLQCLQKQLNGSGLRIDEKHLYVVAAQSIRIVAISGMRHNVHSSIPRHSELLTVF